MKKFLFPILSLVNVVLVSIVFGLGNNPCYSIRTAGTRIPSQDWYSVVWTPISNGSRAFGIVGFFLFIASVVLILVGFLPLKVRKFVNLGATAIMVTTGVFFLKTPEVLQRGNLPGFQITESLIAMAVLMFVAAFLTLVMAVIELLVKEKAE